MSRGGDVLPEPVLRSLEEEYGLPATERCRLMRAGSSVTVFVLTAVGETFVARKLTRSEEEVARQHRLLTHLAAHGLPVALPRLTRAGRVCVALDEGVFTVSSLARGEHPPSGDVATARLAGAALARLHEATMRFDGSAPNPREAMRERFLRRTSGLPERVRQIVADPALCRAHADAAWIGDRVARLQRDLGGTAWERLPRVVIHGDFNRENLLVADGVLTAILDFDLATRDVPAADVAVALQYLARSPAADGPLLLGAPARAFLDAYETTSPLEPAARRAIRPLVEAKLGMSPVRRLRRLATASSETPEAVISALARSTARWRRLHLDGEWSATLGTR